MSTHGTRPQPLRVHRALVIGAGRSGLAAARLLADAGVEVTLVEEADTTPPSPGPGIEVVTGRSAAELVGTGLDLVVPSPGVAEHAPALRRAQELAIAVWSEPELALRRHPRRLLAVTGTNGKTSTTELLAAMGRAGGLTTVACGNIGTPVSEAAGASPGDAVLVAELSSFQLRFAHALHAEVAVLTNLAPDHLDWHGDLAAYQAAKARLFATQREQDWAVVPADDPVAAAVRAGQGAARDATFATHRPVSVGVGWRPGGAQGVLVWSRDGEESVVVEVADLADQDGPVPRHRIANVAAAATAALLAGARLDGVAAAARTLRPGPHRFRTVAIGPRGERYVDDSKATNVHAAVAALTSAGPTVWIAGGLSKGVDLGPLGDALGEVRAAVLIGAAAVELARVCERAGVPAYLATDMDDAVARAAGLAAPGDTVLLAPACASFDQFDSYAHRGEVFIAAARRSATASPTEEVPS
jgi:UDP-N-acetylmuramoylalanine--D-glutamate ligase